MILYDFYIFFLNIFFEILFMTAILVSGRINCIEQNFIFNKYKNDKNVFFFFSINKNTCQDKIDYYTNFIKTNCINIID